METRRAGILWQGDSSFCHSRFSSQTATDVGVAVEKLDKIGWHSRVIGAATPRYRDVTIGLGDNYDVHYGVVRTTSTDKRLPTLLRDMPMEKSTWESSEPAKSIRAELIGFLRDNQSLAYTVRELTDEILGSTWARIHAEEREMARVGEETYHEQNSDHELNIVDSFLSREKMNRMWNILDDLVYEGIVEMRFVPGEKTDIPDVSSGVPCYTYSSE